MPSGLAYSCVIAIQLLTLKCAYYTQLIMPPGTNRLSTSIQMFSQQEDKWLLQFMYCSSSSRLLYYVYNIIQRCGLKISFGGINTSVYKLAKQWTDSLSPVGLFMLVVLYVANGCVCPSVDVELSLTHINCRATCRLITQNKPYAV